jgi:hypothetical protein
MPFQFFFNIPASMPADRWTMVVHTLNNDKSAAGRAVIQHFRGSELPFEVEIHVCKNKKKIRKFLVRDLGEGRQEVIRLDAPPPQQRKLKVAEQAG